MDGSSCTVVDNGDGTHTLQCEDGTEVTFSDGADGADGSSCSVTDNEDGTYTLGCDDGTEVTFSDEAEGGSCSVTDNEDGTYTLGCDDGTEVTFSDDTTGDENDDDNDRESASSCSVEDIEDGSYILECDEDAQVVVSGDEAGSTCSLEENSDGTYSLSCQDGTEATLDEWVDGADGNLCSLVDNEDQTYTLSCEEDEEVGDNAEIFVEPLLVDFPFTVPNSQTWQVIEIHNIGGESLYFENFELTGADADSFSYGFISEMNADGSFPPIDEDSDTPPANLEPAADPVYVRVVFHPEDELSKTAQFHIESSDEDVSVDLMGNSSAPCLEVVQGDSFDFGPAALDDITYQILTLRNCSPQMPLELYDVAISDDGGGVFAIDPGSELDFPYELAPGQVVHTMVEFRPDEESQYTGELHIESNDAAEGELFLAVKGYGVDGQCPVAHATGSLDATDGGSDVVSVTNQEVVYLSSEGSYDPDETDLMYEWSIISRPEGSLADVWPSPFEPDPEFEIDIVGEFQIELVVYDATGLRNCKPAIVQIDAVPDSDIHIQLTWSAPDIEATYGGPDPALEIGTDLDLHYVNSQDGTDEWGSNSSVFWHQPTQDWQEHGEAHLTIDSLYGDMPENIDHFDPGMGGMYRVGVHYFSDNEWGGSNAWIRIYFGTDLYGEWHGHLKQTDNFWYVGNILWDETPTVDVMDDLQETHSLTSADG